MKPNNSTIAFIYLFVTSLYITIYVSQFQSLSIVESIPKKKSKKPKKQRKIEVDDEVNSPIPKKISSDHERVEAAKKLYLNEKYLRLIKLANPNIDSKLGVDRPTKKSLEEVLEKLSIVEDEDFNGAVQFVEECLHEPGYEITSASFSDWKERPKYVENLQSDDLRKFAYSLNQIWLDLYKKCDHSVLNQGAVSSHLPMKHPFIVPGGRFIETYYWDNYWILEGLLVSGMYETSKQILENHMHLIEEYDFIPNGSRVYYLNRSQPPYFSNMVMTFYEYCSKSTELTCEEKRNYKKFVLDKALDYMIKEYKYWMRERSIKISHKGVEYKLNLYSPTNDKPRPESYSEDIHTASYCQSETERAKIYKDLSAGAESGIDFSSRWFRSDDPMNIKTIHTSDIIPIDLNSLLYKTENNIAKLLREKGDSMGFKRFRNYSVKRKIVLNSLFWSKQQKCWADYNYKTKMLNDQNFYITNLSPLFNDIKPPKYRVKEIIKKHICPIGVNNMIGVPFSLTNSNEQWDASNIWAPNQYDVIMLLEKVNKDMALSFAKKFFNTVYTGHLKTGMIFEKYSSLEIGERGSGGEYTVQSGFGWTNGTLMSLIKLFGDELIQ